MLVYWILDMYIITITPCDRPEYDSSYHRARPAAKPPPRAATPLPPRPAGAARAF